MSRSHDGQVTHVTQSRTSRSQVKQLTLNDYTLTRLCGAFGERALPTDELTNCIGM